jgi:hypothetical protein
MRDSRLGGSVHSVEGVGGQDSASPGAQIDDGSSLALQHGRKEHVDHLGGGLAVQPQQALLQVGVHFVQEPRVRVRHAHVVHQYAHCDVARRVRNPRQPTVHVLVQEIHHHRPHLLNLRARVTSTVSWRVGGKKKRKEEIGIDFTWTLYLLVSSLVKASSFAPERPRTTTLMFLRANWTVMARPMPSVEPVMSAHSP